MEVKTDWLKATATINENEEVIKEKGLEAPLSFAVYRGNDWVGRFTLAPMPGCCGVVVSCFSSLTNPVGLHLGREFHLLKERAARELGYSRMIATTETSNFKELIGAAKNGWRLNEAFTNERTGHQLVVMEKAL